MVTTVVYHFAGGTGWCMVSVNCTQKLLNGKFRSRLACTICAVESTNYRKSETSLTIATGSGTGGKNFSARIFRLAILEYLSNVPFILEIFQSDKPNWR